MKWSVRRGSLWRSSYHFAVDREFTALDGIGGSGIIEQVTTHDNGS
jgi:hypothetical protein